MQKSALGALQRHARYARNRRSLDVRFGKARIDQLGDLLHRRAAHATHPQRHTTRHKAQIRTLPLPAKTDRNPFFDSEFFLLSPLARLARKVEQALRRETATGFPDDLARKLFFSREGFQHSVRITLHAPSLRRVFERKAQRLFCRRAPHDEQTLPLSLLFFFCVRLDLSLSPSPLQRARDDVSAVMPPRQREQDSLPVGNRRKT